MSSNAQRFARVNGNLVDDIKLELRLQEHHLTGALERSIKEIIIEKGDTIELSAEALEYLEDLEKGVPASQIVINDQTLADMTRYVQLRMGYQGSRAQQVAYLILRKQQQEGMPTEASKRFSRTGERTKAVSTVFEVNNDRYSKMIDDEASGIIDAEFGKITSRNL